VRRAQSTPRFVLGDPPKVGVATRFEADSYPGGMKEIDSDRSERDREISNVIIPIIVIGLFALLAVVVFRGL